MVTKVSSQKTGEKGGTPPALDSQEPVRAPSWKVDPSERAAPPVAEVEEAPQEADEEALPTPASERAPAPSKAPQFPYPNWVRWIFPLIFFIIFALQFLSREWPRIQRSTASPVLREGVLCQGVSENRLPINPKSVFSVRQDRRVMFVGRWNGSASGHRTALRWYSPDGSLQHTQSPSVQSQAGADGFITIGFLALQPAMPAGPWRVEVFLDEEFAARFAFTLRE